MTPTEGPGDSGRRETTEAASTPVTSPIFHASPAKPGSHRMELRLDSLDQLFNTMDPSPFHQKDLDHDAEEFIVSWVQEFHRPEPVDLVIHLTQAPPDAGAQQLAADAIHNYFAYRARLNDLEFKRLMKVGRMSLLVGLSFLVLCFLTIEFFLLHGPAPVPGFLREGLTIAGWVAMWRPLEIYLYEWWPLRHRGQIYLKLSRMPVEVRTSAGANQTDKASGMTS